MLDQIRAMPKDEQDILFESMRADPAVFAQVCLSHIVTHIPEFHKQIYSTLAARYQYNAFVLFRGAAKSTLSHVIMGIYNICFRKEKVMIWISESIGQASADLISVQDEIESNEILKYFFGNLKGKIWNKEESEFANGVYVIVKGYGSRIRGIKWKNQRPTLICLDDFESESNSRTAEQRKSVQEWINRQILPAEDASLTSNTTFQFWGTIVHPEAFLAKVKNLSYFAPPNGFYYEAAIETNGVPTWPERYSAAYIRSKENYYREQHDYASFLQEYYNVPAITGQALFKTEMISMVKGRFRKFENLTYVEDGDILTPINVFIGIDPARSISATADNTSIVAIGITPKNEKIILEVFAEKIQPNQQVEALFQFAEIFGPRHIVIETQGYQLALANWCRTRMGEGKRPTFAIVEFQTNRSKNDKYLMGLEPLINYGEMKYIEDCPGIDKLFIELRAFNMDSREHDDTVDGLFLAYHNSYKPPDFNVAERLEDMKSGRKKIKKRRDWFTL